MKYIKNIDGLRAIAIWLVILFHLGVPGFEAGWLGVQLFFSISGFLITTILINSKNSENSPSEYFIKFYKKRFLRIFPLYLLYIGINFCIMTAYGKPTSNYPYYLLHLQNYIFGLSEFKSTQGFLAHTWSLAVEEQFYLFWPLVVYYLSIKRLTYLCIFLIMLAPAVRSAIYATTENPYLYFSTLPSCMDALCVGALLAIIREKSQLIFNRNLAIFGLTISLLAFAVLSLSLPPGTYASPSLWVPQSGYLLSLFSFISAFSLWCVLENSWLSPMLENKFLTYTGKISYGLYMYHGLCISVMERITENKFISAIVGVCASYIVAHVSYLYFERYFTSMKSWNRIA